MLFIVYQFEKCMLSNNINKLSTIDQAAYIQNKGEFLICRLDNKCMYKLYYFNDHFVELRFDADREIFDNVEIITGTEKVNPYLEYIDL